MELFNVQLLLGKDINGSVTYTLPVSSKIYRAFLNANTAYSLVVPQNVNCAFFSYNSGGNVWVDFVTTATVPSVGFSATTSELNPVTRFVSTSQTLSFISENNAEVEVAFYYLKG